MMTIQAAGTTRTVRGRFASPHSPWGVTMVLLPNWQWGFRVGPNGMIFARKEAAEAFARKRMTRKVTFN